MNLKPYFVYIVECSDSTYYTGISYDIEQRIKKHNSGKGAKYTRARLPVKLKYSKKLKSYNAACGREAEIKRMSRQEKEKLFK